MEIKWTRNAEHDVLLLCQKARKEGYLACGEKN